MENVCSRNQGINEGDAADRYHQADIVFGKEEHKEPGGNDIGDEAGNDIH